MSYNVSAYTPETENESFSDVAHMRITSTTDLVDSILFGQDYCDSLGYEGIQPPLDKFKPQIVELVKNKNRRYFKFITFTAIEVMRIINNNSNELRSENVNNDILRYWNDLSNRYTAADGQLIKNFTDDQLLTIENHLADIALDENNTHWIIGDYDYEDNSFFDVFLFVHELRKSYAARPNDFQEFLYY